MIIQVYFLAGLLYTALFPSLRFWRRRWWVTLMPFGTWQRGRATFQAPTPIIEIIFSPFPPTELSNYGTPWRRYATWPVSPRMQPHECVLSRIIARGYD